MVVLGTGCQELPTTVPDFASPGPASLHVSPTSSPDDHWNPNHTLHGHGAGSSWFLVRDQTQAEYVQVYQDGIHTVNFEITEINGVPHLVTVRSPDGLFWVTLDQYGNLINSSEGCLMGICPQSDDPCRTHLNSARGHLMASGFFTVGGAGVGLLSIWAQPLRPVAMGSIIFGVSHFGTAVAEYGAYYSCRSGPPQGSGGGELEPPPNIT
jgi:hypothetical protein